MLYRNHWKGKNYWKKLNFSICILYLNIITIDINYSKKFYMITLLNFTFKNR